MPKKKKSLYTDGDIYTKEGNEFAEEVLAALVPIIDRYSSSGFKTRDIEDAATNQVRYIVQFLYLNLGVPGGKYT